MLTLIRRFAGWTFSLGQPLVMNFWVRRSLLIDHPVLLLADQVSEQSASESEDEPDDSTNPDEGGTGPRPNNPEKVAGEPGDEQMSLIEAKRFLAEPAIRALLFRERIVAVHEALTSLEADSREWVWSPPERTADELAVIAELNHEAARLVGSDALQHSTAYALGWRLQRAGRSRRAVAAFLRAAGIAGRLAGDALAAEALRSAGVVEYELGRGEVALRHLHQARELAQRAGTVTEASALTAIATVQIAQGSFSAAHQSLNDALSLCVAGKSQPVRAEALSLQSRLLLLEGEPAAAIDSIREAVSIWRQRHDRHAELATLRLQHEACRFLGERDELVATQQRLVELNAEINRGSGTAETAGAEGLLADVLGQIREFRHQLDYEQRLLQRCRDTADHRGEADALARLGTTFGQVRNEAQADECFAQAVELDRKNGCLFRLGLVQTQWALALNACGRLEQAVKRQQAAVAANRRMGWRVDLCEALSRLGGLLLALGQFDEAHEAFDEAGDLARELGWKTGEFHAAIGLAGLTQQSGVGGEAGGETTHVVRLLQRALELAAQSHSIDAKIQTRLELSRLLLARGRQETHDVAQAAARLDEARDLADSLGDPDVLREVLTLCGRCEEAAPRDGWKERARDHYVNAIRCYCQQRLAAPGITDEPFETPYRMGLQVASRSLFDRAIEAADRLGEDELLFWITELKHAQILAELLRGDFLFLVPPLDELDRSRMPTPAAGEALLVFSLRQAGDDGHPSGLVALLKLPDGSICKERISFEDVARLESDWRSELQSTGESVRRVQEQMRGGRRTLTADEERGLHQAGYLEADNWKPVLDARLGQLRRLLFPGALETACRENSIERLVIVPEGPLYRIPFAALRDEPRKKYLIDEFETVVVPSVALWRECRERVPAAAETALLGVAEPLGSDLAGSGDADFIRERLAAELPPLPKIVLSGPDATRQRFLEAGQSSDMIHLLLHGSSEPSAPLSTGSPQARPNGAATSRIELPSSEVTGEDARLMTDRELFRLVHEGYRFPACRLMTMNVCYSFLESDPASSIEETEAESASAGAASPASASTGEVSGFPAAVLALGVPTLVASQWEVFREPGRLFFAAFYRHFARDGATAAAAYRQALADVRAQTDEDSGSDYRWFDNPWFWASLALMGDGGRRYER